MKTYFYSILILFSIYCCTSNGTDEICKKMAELPEDSLVNLSGRIIISPEGRFILDTKSKAALAQTSKFKTELQTCSKETEEFIKENYEDYLKEVNADNDFWVKVTGLYQTSKDFEGVPIFTIHFLTAIRKDEVGKVDSMRVVNEEVKEETK